MTMESRPLAGRFATPRTLCIHLFDKMLKEQMVGRSIPAGSPLSQMLDRCGMPPKIWRLKRAGIPDRRSILGLLRLDAGQPSAYFWAPTPESGGSNGERPCPH